MPAEDHRPDEHAARPATATGTDAGALMFLSGGGELGAMMRAHDWSASPLGDPRGWPQALRTVVALMLNSKFPMFVAWGEQLGFLYNDSYREVLGDKHPASLGRPFHDIWAEIWHDIGPMVERALQGEATYADRMYLVMNRHGYEEPTWFTFSYSPVRNEDGVVAGMYCACVEVTEQVLAEKYRDAENERLRGLFAQAPGIMAVLRGPEHVFELTNGSYMQLIGHRQILGKSAREALPEVVGQGFFELLDRVYTSGEPFVGTALPVRLQREPEGPLEERYIDFVYQPIRDAAGSVTGIFVEGADVTSRKQVEDELRAANAQKDQFLAMLAHELRNPLAPIVTAAQLLKLGRTDPRSVASASDIIARQAEHMTDLVNDLLDVSRVTRGLVTLEKEELDLNVIVAAAVEQVRPLVDARRHSLTLQLSGEPAHVIGDRTRLVQVISNILNNAAKYTAPGGSIGLAVHTEGELVYVTVRDTGVGIAPEVLPYIFDLFTQAERTPDRSQGGLGIGLALVKSLIALHGGSVRAESPGLGQGSAFSLCLPRVAPPAGLRSEAPAARGAGAGEDACLRVMVVDDNVDAAQMLAALLEVQGHAVSVEYDGGGALARAREERPDVLLLDIGLPDIDGYELARRLRAQPENAGATLVALTGYGQRQDREEARQAGFDHYLVKPADLNEVNEVLAEAEARR
ncbi:PAS domain-containing protein [Massilia sp. YIM B02763]|uniref:hybrid sensor histidine kinase/response regulator n=1 Tax=Massilia sp. YIM B02763 TaxID=3050130 RepID=UPI0025B6F477|nr:ATP-binding protein [Massilia sp. YIM B02763]MDN4054085.1 PAS domain-containing protein [Massilia sp. YIM B02763]